MWRAAIDAGKRSPAGFKAAPAWMTSLGKLSEGNIHTLGAYYRPWK